MKATKKNICKKPTFENNEEQRLKNVANIMEAITDAIPEGSTIHDVVDALVAKVAEIITFIHKDAGRDIGQGCYEYVVDYLKHAYETILKEEEQG